jgi:putative membrane protein
MSQRPPSEPILPYLLVALWALAMISVPILGWTLGDEAVRYGIIAGVLLQAAASLAALATAWGLGATLKLVLVVLPAAWAVEFVGSRTGFPFGSYDYTQALQPQLLGVPLLIPLAWLMMLPAAWAIAEMLVGRGRSPASRFRFLGLAALAFTAWDLFLDPQMVSWGYWIWENPGGYFGIPWVNFAGWILSAFLIGALVFGLLPQTLRLPHRPLLVIYTVTWALQTIGLALFWGMPGPAAVGFFAMGIFVWLGWRAHLRGPRRAPTVEQMSTPHKPATGAG